MSKGAAGPFSMAQTSAEKLLEYLFGLTDYDLTTIFVGTPSVNDQLIGKVVSIDAINDMRMAHRVYSQAHDFKKISVTKSESRTVVEVQVLVPVTGKEVVLDIVMVSDCQDSKITDARIYYSPWRLRLRKNRPRILDTKPEIDVAEGYMRKYMVAIHTGDTGGAVESFEPDGAFVGPSGNIYIGYKELNKVLSYILYLGKAALEYCTITDDGERCAVEYNIQTLGDVPLPPYGGCAVYQRGPTGKIQYAHVYDENNLLPNKFLQPLPENPSCYGPWPGEEGLW